MAIAAAVSMGLYWLTELPLGIPGEWTWNRIRHEVVIESVLGGVPVMIAGGVYLLLVCHGAQRMNKASRLEVSGWILGLMATAFSWLFAIQEAPPEGHRLSKGPWVLYYPAMTGYFHKARYEIRDTSEFIKNYESLMAEGDVLHVGTHPPGLFIMYRGLMSIMVDSPRLVAFLNWVQPQSVRDGLNVIGENLPESKKAHFERDRAVLWLGVLLAHASVCWVVVPLFGILSRTESRETAWKVCCFWPLIPTVAVFLPKDDVLFCGIVMSFVWCWLKAVESRSRTSALCCAAAAFLGFLGLCLSLVFLPIGLVAIIAGVVRGRRVEDERSAERSFWVNVRENMHKQWLAWLSGLLTFAGLLGMARGLLGLDLLAIWRLNLRNHAAFYDQYARTYWKWLPVNVLELILALGVPLAVLIVISIGRSLRSQSVARRASVLAVGVVWFFLWLSGKNSGEAARLWIPLMPLAVWLLPAVIDSREENGVTGLSTREWLWSLGLQAVVCAATVTRVSGFHFGG